ncbi:MAG: hypothetical protein OQJ89_15180 [Kangiellaceae bacterium]|nr:hypothetical protein [Kangiellaceae bacterium]MCW9000666.1 hypothetical protein [Kangiellaceae bacterium]MCW9018313.1 hypothetical protein [Kangiellaceae bacterium]
MKLGILMPFLAQELTQELVKIGEPKLADSVSQLEILGRCDCDNQSCAAFYTAEKHVWSGNEIRHVIPHVKGVFSVDVFKDEIVFIEIMGRQDVRERLLAVCP